MNQSYRINTLHRGKYMLSFFSLMILAGIITSAIDVSEIVKVISILFSIPIILFLSIRWSKNFSQWTLNEHELQIKFGTKRFIYPLSEIDHIKSLTRSGGNLYVIHLKKSTPKRFWRNKLFTQDDDHTDLQHALAKHEVEFYKM